MRKVILFLVVCMLTVVSSSAITVPATKDPATTSVESQKAESSKKVSKESMEFFAKLTPEQYEFLRGKKMNFFERISFKASQKRVIRQLAKHEAKVKAGAADDTEGFNVGGFLLGLLLGLLGVLGAYLFSKDRNLRKWTWIGWGVWVVIVLLAFAL